VEQLERIVNEGVSEAVKGDDELWRQVKTRADAAWAAALDAEEVFWPDVTERGAEKDVVGGSGAVRSMGTGQLNGTDGKRSTDLDCERCERIANEQAPV
jgi:hypothetical protein